MSEVEHACPHFVIGDESPLGFLPNQSSHHVYLFLSELLDIIIVVFQLDN